MWLYIIQIRGGNNLKLLSCLAECENQCVKHVLPYEMPCSDYQKLSEDCSVSGAAGALLTWTLMALELSCSMWKLACKAHVALQDASWRF
jgi:hypothetical protein